MSYKRKPENIAKACISLITTFSKMSIVEAEVFEIRKKNTITGYKIVPVSEFILWVKISIEEFDYLVSAKKILKCVAPGASAPFVFLTNYK